jgi:hypothetical protein
VSEQVRHPPVAEQNQAGNHCARVTVSSSGSSKAGALVTNANVSSGGAVGGQNAVRTAWSPERMP